MTASRRVPCPSLEARPMPAPPDADPRGGILLTDFEAGPLRPWCGWISTASSRRQRRRQPDPPPQLPRPHRQRAACRRSSTRRDSRKTSAGRQRRRDRGRGGSANEGEDRQRADDPEARGDRQGLVKAGRERLMHRGATGRGAARALRWPARRSAPGPDRNPPLGSGRPPDGTPADCADRRRAGRGSAGSGPHRGISTGGAGRSHRPGPRGSQARVPRLAACTLLGCPGLVRVG